MMDSPSSTDELIAFISGIPHWVADAGLSPEGAHESAEVLEALVSTLQSAGYPPVDVSGPEPASFPPPSNRIAAAANQAEGLLRGLDPEGWSIEVGEETIEEHVRTAMGHLQSLATNP